MVSACDEETTTVVGGYITIMLGKAINEVGATHTFVITATATSAAPDSWSLLNYTVSPTLDSQSVTGATEALDGMSATWELTINNYEPGVFQASATVSIGFGSTTVTVSTGSGGDNSADAQKAYIAARITLDPDAKTNEVGDPHTFTAYLEINYGSGWQDMAGEMISILKASGPGTLSGGPYVTGSDGKVSVILNSTKPGVTIVTATWSRIMLGVLLTATDPADKTWIKIDYTITKTVPDVGGDGAARTIDAAGDVISYKIEVKNTGNQTLIGVSVSDPLLGSLSGPTETLTSDGIFEPNETWTYTGSYTVLQSDINDNGGGDGDIDNTATVSRAGNQ